MNDMWKYALFLLIKKLHIHFVYGTHDWKCSSCSGHKSAQVSKLRNLKWRYLEHALFCNHLVVLQQNYTNAPTG
jgi:hypothetical protein